jgi:hypothetical protein
VKNVQILLASAVSVMAIIAGVVVIGSSPDREIEVASGADVTAQEPALGLV